MNKENKGDLVCIIRNDKDIKNTNKLKSFDKLKCEKIYRHMEPENINNYFKEYKCDQGYSLECCPNPDIDKMARSIIYISGASGSGKSFYTMSYLKLYKSIFKNNDVYFISSLYEDPTCDIYKSLFKRVKLDDKFLNSQIPLSDFKNSLVIFDDIDVIADKNIRQKVFNILNGLLQTGRHSNTSIVYINHQPCQGVLTKTILAESHSVVVFPHCAGGRTLKYLLNGYFGMSNKQVDDLKKIQTRWVCIIKGFPLLVAYQKGIYCLNN